MRVTAKYAWWLVTLLALPAMQGCDKKTPPQQTQTLAPPIVDTPPPKAPQVSTADLPPPVVGKPQPAQPAPDTTPKPAETQKPVHHPKKPATTPTPATTTDTASAAPAPSVSAVGQLSSGSSGDKRTQTEETIAATEKGVNAITRTLNDTETKTAAQIREFLKQAREALTTGDVDGAHTLAMKAKVLLTELNP